MRWGILVLGIILIIIGIFLYFTGSNMVYVGNLAMNEINDYNVYGIPIGDLLKTLSPDVQTSYYSALNTVQSGQQIIMFGSIFGIIGLIICIAGMVAPSKKEKYQTKVSATSSPPVIIREEPKEILRPNRRCPECGRSIPFDAKRCPYCEKDFEHRKISQVEKKEVKEIKEEKKLVEKKELLQFCHECGKRLNEDVDFCPYCGNKLNKLEE